MSYPAFPKRLHGGARIMNRPSPLNIRIIDQNAMPMFIEMQRRGMLLDKDKTRALDSRLTHEISAIQRECMDAFGCDISSDDQVYELLFNKLGLPRDGIKWTKSKKRLTVDDDALETLLPYHPVTARIREFRQRRKITSTYTGPLLQKAIDAPDGRVRTTLKLTRVVSGRVSSSDPNLMNIPARSALGKEVRKLFVPSKGRVLISVDQSQIEMRVAAHEANEVAMIETFKLKRDLHKQTASLMFRVAYDDVTSEQRTSAKSAGFGVLYGITAIGLLIYFIAQGATGWTEEKCQELIDKWFVAYPNIRKWLRLQQQRAKQYGMVWCMFGRVRFIPEMRSSQEYVQSQGERNCGNTPIQAGAQATMKIAMAYIWDVIMQKWWARGYDPWVLMQVHDELLFEVEEEIAEEFKRDCQEAIENVVQLRVPIKCGGSISALSWGDLEK